MKETRITPTKKEFRKYYGLISSQYRIECDPLRVRTHYLVEKETGLFTRLEKENKYRRSQIYLTTKDNKKISIRAYNSWFLEMLHVCPHDMYS